MRHYYTDDTIFGPHNWFYFGRFYHEMVAAAPMDEVSRFVEVGAFLGRSAAYLGVEIINSGKPIHLYVVDHFNGSREHLGIDCSRLFERFCSNLRPVTDKMGDRFHVYHMESVKAARKMKKPRFDLVFLDGSHEAHDVVADIQAWLPKVKPGGVLAGDDWKMAGVRIAVEHQLGKGRVGHPTDSQYPWWYWTKPTTSSSE